ncbi:SigE family RNA polymerase sigma factor [Streptomyces sp. CC219B]|uniref:SigE family RNA polymerase sigma factor n=1 Tax=Streptomyces sp. CC219B TaxID=3044574 RepID=UPI0024A91745|nr:SigE family RNA polymerase sigma factor [Streptomyces sp. CC219B]
MSTARTLEEFQGFARTLTPRLFRTALLMSGDWHLAEDLVQTALGKIFSSWSRVRRTDSPEAYAHTVLMRTYISHRRLRRSTERPVATLPEPSAASDPDGALRVTLLAALAELPLRDRAVVVLRYWEDRSVEETASVLGMTQSSVRNRSSRALARLRRTIGDGQDSIAVR